MYKKIIAGVMALSVVTSTAATTIPFTNDVSANAATTGQLFGEGTFNDGAGLPWHICENATGKMSFDIDKSTGTYKLTIVNPGGQSNGGVDRWDCQFRHRGLTIKEGHTYRFTYSIKASNAGKMYAKIGNMVNDDQELWHGNGKLLTMPALGNDASNEDVVTALKTAKESGSDVKYYEGWNTWKNNQIPANQWVTVAYEFKYIGDQNEGISSDHWEKFPVAEDGTKSVYGTAELAFHLGGDGQFTPGGCFPAGTEIEFDNIALIDVDDPTEDYQIAEKYERNSILVNQLGYVKGLNKKATLVVEKGDDTPKEFKVVDSTGKAVYTGKSTPKGADEASGDYVHILDFSDLNTAGKGYHVECGTAKSYDFAIDAATTGGTNSIYNGLLRDSLNYFYLNRSGIDIESKYITSGDKTMLSRGAGHATVDKAAYIQDKWIDIYESAAQAKTGKTMDVTGGWYDAGDYGKYVVNGGISVWTLQNLYERNAINGTNKNKFADGTMSIPENGNKYPDLLDETRYELDFMLKMQREDGMVYHKAQDQKWTGLAVRPDDETMYTDDGGYVRIVKPVSTAATLNLAATAAQAARLWKGIDDAYAEKCLAAAEKAYKAAKADPENYAPMEQAKGAGAYGDTYVEDDFYWAACELFATTGDKSYYTDLSGYKNASNPNGDDKAFSITTQLYGGENTGSVTSFTWGSTAGLGSLSLALHKDKLEASDAKALTDAITKAADRYIEIENQEGYGIPYQGNDFTDEVNCPGQKFHGYEWGSNSMVINNAIVMAYAADLNPDSADKYANGVVSAMDYLLGRNAGEYSYVTGYGTHTTKYPHHRFWSGLIDSTLPTAPNGVLSGGPNAGMPDPWIKGAGYKPNTLPSQLCYLDHIESWGTNECTINWNSPLAWVTSYMEDYVSDNDTPTPTPDSSTVDSSSTVVSTPDSSKADSSKTDSSKTDVSTPDSSKADPVTAKKGDVNKDGVIDSADALEILKYVVGIVTNLDMDVADVDDNGAINTLDALQVLKYVVGLVKF